MKNYAVALLALLAACSTDNDEPSLTLTALTDTSQVFVPGDTIALVATVNGIGSATYVWSAGGETVPGATSSSVTVRITDAITEPTTFDITVQVTGSDKDNLSVTLRDSVTLTVRPGSRTNAAPIANADTYTVGANGVLTAGASVLANDSDDDYYGTLLRAVLSTTTSRGVLVFNSDGTFSYRPNADFAGVDTFQYVATDGVLASTPATVTINVTAVNTAPVAVTDTYSIGQDILLAGDSVLANDTDDNFGGSILTATLVDNATNGTLVLNLDGTFSYMPNASYVGPDSFTYVATDGELASATTTVTITVNATNQAPVAFADSYSVGKNYTLNAVTVLTNDDDDDFGGSTLTAMLVANVDTGDLAFQADGTFVYTPEADFIGTATFTYKAFDGELASEPVTVVITVNDANQAPIAVADSLFVFEGTTDNVLDVLANDDDDDFGGSTLSARVLTQPEHGTLSPALAYTPTAGFVGVDSFTYDAWDGELSSAETTVTIDVRSSAPIAAEDAYSVEENTTLTVTLAGGVLRNDSSHVSAPLSAILDTGPAHGTLTLNSDGTFTYTPTSHYEGVDTFRYKATDGARVSTPMLVTITVQRGPAPNAVDDRESATTGVTESYVILANDDFGGAFPLSGGVVITIVSGSTNGSTIVVNGTTIDYTSAASGGDSFQYTVTNSGGFVSNVATVYINQ